jgi:hypothetical protein
LKLTSTTSSVTKTARLRKGIRRQVVSRLSEDYRKRLFDRFDIELGTIMREQIAVVMAERMPGFVDDILDAEYVPVSNYGERKPATTFRAEVIESIAKNLKYEPKNYSSEENAFTRAVKSIVELKTGEIKKEITAHVDAQFRQDALAFAVKQLSERLGLDKK